MGEIIDLGIDRNTATYEEINNAYAIYWQGRRDQHDNNYQWFRLRIKQLGYKSVVQFTKQNSLPVTAGTVANYFRGNSTMPLYIIKYLCYGLKVTPNVLLTQLGYYNSKGQEIVEL